MRRSFIFRFHSPHLVARLLMYLYTSDYPLRLLNFDEAMAKSTQFFALAAIEGDGNVPSTSALLLHVRMCIFANKLGLSTLEVLSTEKFCKVFSPIFFLPDDDYNIEDSSLNSLIAASREIYAASVAQTRILRHRVLDAIQTYKPSNLLRRVEFKHLLKEYPQISLDLFSSTVTQTSGICDRCEEIGGVFRPICEHTGMDFCEESECLKELSCWNCGRIGQIRKYSRCPKVEA